MFIRIGIYWKGILFLPYKLTDSYLSQCRKVVPAELDWQHLPTEYPSTLIDSMHVGKVFAGSWDGETEKWKKKLIISIPQHHRKRESLLEKEQKLTYF